VPISSGGVPAELRTLTKKQFWNEETVPRISRIEIFKRGTSQGETLTAQKSPLQKKGSSLFSVGRLLGGFGLLSATLRLLKVESGINGILPAGGGPCHLFRFSLEQASLRAGEGNCILRSTALRSFLAANCQPQKPFGSWSGGQTGKFAFWVVVDWSTKDDTGRTFYRSAGSGSAMASERMPL
jgi:hypothetical protein